MPKVLDARRIVIPAQAGIQYFVAAALDSRSRVPRVGNDIKQRG
jgi:hypothetical protein